MAFIAQLIVQCKSKRLLFKDGKHNHDFLCRAGNWMNQKIFLKLHIRGHESFPSSLLAAYWRRNPRRTTSLYFPTLVSVQRKTRHVAQTGVTAHPNTKCCHSLNYIFDHVCAQVLYLPVQLWNLHIKIKYTKHTIWTRVCDHCIFNVFCLTVSRV